MRVGVCVRVGGFVTRRSPVAFNVRPGSLRENLTPQNLRSTTTTSHRTNAKKVQAAVVAAEARWATAFFWMMI